MQANQQTNEPTNEPTEDAPEETTDQPAEGQAADEDNAQAQQDEEPEEDKIDHGQRWAEALRFDIEPLIVTASPWCAARSSRGMIAA